MPDMVRPTWSSTKKPAVKIMPEYMHKRGLQRAIWYASKWGIEVKIVRRLPNASDNIFYNFESDCVINWKQKKILVKHDIKNPCAIIHELAHCLDPESRTPSHALEASGCMLAFEYYSIRWLRVSGWKHWMSTYVLTDDGRDWPNTEPKERLSCIKKSFRKALQFGLLTKDKKPTYQVPKRKDKYENRTRR